MADIVLAKAGDKLTKRVRLVWAKRLKRALTEAPETVKPKTEGSRGAWFCMHCGEVHQNNLMAWSHAEKHPKHAWLSLDSGDLEEP